MKEKQKKQKFLRKGEKGITLIALVITVIVLLILAGVSIAMLAGDKGILNQASKSTIQNAHATVKEALLLEYNSYLTELNISKCDLSEGIEIASIQTITIPAEEKENFAGQTTTFWNYLLSKNYIDENGIVNVVNLTGTNLSIGNGTDTKDVYKIEDEEDKYILKYYNEDAVSETLLELTKSNSNNSKIKKLIIKDSDDRVGGDITIQYEEGMTWNEWIESSYNDGSFRKNSGKVSYYLDGEYCADIYNSASDVFIGSEKIDGSNEYFFGDKAPI